MSEGQEKDWQCLLIDYFSDLLVDVLLLLSFVVFLMPRPSLPSDS